MNESLVFAVLIGGFLFWAWTRVDAANSERIKQWQLSLDLQEELNGLARKHAEQRRRDLYDFRDYVVNLEANWDTASPDPEAPLDAVLEVWIKERIAGRV